MAIINKHQHSKMLRGIGLKPVLDVFLSTQIMEIHYWGSPSLTTTWKTDKNNEQSSYHLKWKPFLKTYVFTLLIMCFSGHSCKATCCKKQEADKAAKKHVREDSNRDAVAQMERRKP